MGREHKIISALGPTDVPVAPALGLCTDDDGERRAVLRHGLRRRARPPRRQPPLDVDHRRSPRATPATRSPTRWPRSTPSTPTRSASATSARRRTTSPASSSAGTASGRSRRPASSRSSTRSTTRCSARVPEQGPAAIVHGDYRLDNCMTDDDGNVIAVLDWEICTLGDPLADVGLLMVYWTDADDAVTRCCSPRPPLGRASSPARRCSTATPSRAAATSRRSTTTSRSATGSSRASSRASTRATSAARWAAPTRRPSRASRSRSSAAPSRPPPRRMGRLG